MQALIIVFFIIILLWAVRKKYNKKIIWFYRPNCGWCNKMESAWQQLERSTMFSIIPIETQKININDPVNHSIAQTYGVSGVPFIIKLTQDQSHNIYNGDRSFQDMYQWAYL
jgi:thiol-disulfide isomerase/thioredoxin